MRFFPSCIVPVLVIAMAADAGPLRVIGDPMRDARQTIQARKILADDPNLAAWNLGVTVQDRVATLWGPVPSAEVAFRAELALKTMIELAEVRNALFLSDALKPMRVPAKFDNPPGYLPDHLPPPVPKLPRPLPRSEFSLGQEVLDAVRSQSVRSVGND